MVSCMHCMLPVSSDYHDGGVDDMGDGDHPQEGDSEGMTHHPNTAEGTYHEGVPAEQPHQPEVNHQGETPHPQQEVNHQEGTPEEHAQEQEPTQVHEQEEPSHGGASDPTEGQPSVDTTSPSSETHEEPTVNADHHEQQQQVMWHSMMISLLISYHSLSSQLKCCGKLVYSINKHYCLAHLLHKISIL